MYDLFDLLDLNDGPTNYSVARAVMLGILLPHFADDPELARQPLAWHITRLEKAGELHQLQILVDKFGRICGHVIWTHADLKLEANLLKFGPICVGAEQFSTGTNTWLTDLKINFGLFPDFIQYMRDKELINTDSVCYFKYKNRRRIAKKLALSKLTFMNKPIHVKVGYKRRTEFETNDGLLHAFRINLGNAIRIGEIFSLMKDEPGYASMPLNAAVARVRFPTSLFQYKIYRDEDNVPCGFITWGWLSGTQIKNLKLSAWGLNPYQWNEGANLCAFDCVLKEPSYSKIFDDIDFNLYPNTSISFCNIDDRSEHNRVVTIPAENRAGLTKNFACADLLNISHLLNMITRNKHD